MSQQQQTYKLSAAQILPTAQHTATVFMVHGFGDIQQGNGWADLFQIVAGEMPWVKWVFPHSPKIKMTFRGGEVLPAWFDFFGTLSENKGEDEAGMLVTVDKLTSWILSESQTSNIPTSRIMLGGFSQGCAMTLLTTIKSRSLEEGGFGKLGGIFGLGGFLPLKAKAKEFLGPSNPNLSTPMHLFHGTADTAVTLSRAYATRDSLKELGFSPEFKEYEGLEHSANMEEIRDVGEFVRRCLPEI